MPEDATVPVGIDLGTTFSAVAYIDSTGHPTIVRNSEGGLTTPSVVFLDHSQAIVGQEALNAGLQEPERLADFVKRDMGDEAVHKLLRGEKIPAEVIQAIILKHLKEDAELKLGPLSRAVITVPAFFNEPCRQATVDAARLAGIDLIDIINEPTAAAITYGIEQGFLNSRGESLKEETVLVYDLGGGTFDVTLMQIDGAQFTALASAGDVYLGGVDFDTRIADFIAGEFLNEFAIDLREDESAHQELMQKANSAKQSLSVRDSVGFFFNYETHRFRRDLTREKFEELTEDLVERTRQTVEQVLTQNNYSWKDLTRILLVGGSTRMPAVIKMLEECSGRTVDRSLSPDEAVAQGAALYAGFCLNSDSTIRYGISVSNVSSHDLGVLGVEASSNRKRRHIMIARNSTLPCGRIHRFKTAQDNQNSIKVEVIEGGDDSGNNSTHIGRCVIRDLPKNLPARTPVDVTFQYGNNGRLVVHAILPDTGTEAVLSLNRATGLPEDKFAYWKSRLEAGFGDSTVESADSEASGLPYSNNESNDSKHMEITEDIPDEINSDQSFVFDEPAQTGVVHQETSISEEKPPPEQKSTRGSWKDRRKKLTGDS